ncbi:hypothetical protein BOTBODRAFT_309207 [Botryobasidium botryosum FD-172 SS1]|uniref:Protein EFR3 n=1 Tax=Botryobasidium botryosum (strain FD-172 SS1) TaxID=930990 RepID=A0A067MY09_BOTB1|nr:hypothetical protein BOTBODRAFT_309207 [Botryobasidium botryosum FD-172 SS1]
MRIPLTTPNHVRLITACYPPPLTAAPDYRPNPQDLSKLTYYASNRPGKLHKLASELETRARTEARRAAGGYVKSRALLLVTLEILKAMTAECRRDLNLFSRAVIAAVEASIFSLPTDLEVTARAASVFTAWTTYTDGTLIGVDENITKSYITILQRFAELSVFEGKGDVEVKNRTRLVGIAALTGAIGSDALYTSSSQFESQVGRIAPALVRNLYEAGVVVLREQVASMQSSGNTHASPYLSEFQPQRPLAERRAPSIHIHIDGENGPSDSDVVDATLRALRALLSHANAIQVAYVYQACFDTLDSINSWAQVDFCTWFAQKTTAWTQYHYRYVVPTRLVERLLNTGDLPATIPLQISLIRMLTSVFTSPTPLVNLSTSDVVSNLVALILRRVAINPNDALLPQLVECVASLGTHVYYADQIQDLVEELASRLVGIQINGISGRGSVGDEKGRTEGIKCLLAAMVGLIQTADKSVHGPSHATRSRDGRPSTDDGHRKLDQSVVVDEARSERTAASTAQGRRNKVSPEIWQEILALLCESDYSVRANSARALVFFLQNEAPKEEGASEGDAEMFKRAGNHPMRTRTLSTDSSSRFLNALHASAYTLAVSPSLGLSSHEPSGDSSHTSSSQGVNILPSSQPSVEGSHDRGTGSQENGGATQQRPRTASMPRPRKVARALTRLDHCTLTHMSSTAPAPATTHDYAYLLNILTAVHETFPTRAILTGVPMLFALDTAASRKVDEEDTDSGNVRRRAVRELLCRVWAVIGKVWECDVLHESAQKALFGLSPILPNVPLAPVVVLDEDEEASQHSRASSGVPYLDVSFSQEQVLMDPKMIISVLAANNQIQLATGLDQANLKKRLAKEWNTEIALKESVERLSTHEHLGGPSMPSLLKFSPALMNIDNMSLQSLIRTNKGVGIGDLREALEGRPSSSTSALVGAASIFTAESSIHPHQSGPNRSPGGASQKKRLHGRPGEVRDVLNQLGVGKLNSSGLLRAPFSERKTSIRSSTASALAPPYQT